MKNNNLLIIAAVIAVGCFVMLFISSQTVSKTQKDLNQERYNRLVAEEKLEKSQGQIKFLENDLTNVKNQMQGVQSNLEKEQQSNSNLQTELDKMTKLKGVLEEQLKSALVPPAPALPPAGK